MRKDEYLWTLKEGGRTPTTLSSQTPCETRQLVPFHTMIRDIPEYFGLRGSHPLSVGLHYVHTQTNQNLRTFKEGSRTLTAMPG